MIYLKKSGKTITIYEGVVNQRNVFCVEHRTAVKNGSIYTVDIEREVTDPILAEIIMKRFNYWKSRFRLLDK